MLGLKLGQVMQAGGSLDQFVFPIPIQAEDAGMTETRRPGKM
jgi:hypothetical protein